MIARILLESGEIVEIEDANSVLVFNRRTLKNNETVKVPVQVSVLCDPDLFKDQNFDYDDVLKIELLFDRSENRNLLKGSEVKYKRKDK